MTLNEYINRLQEIKKEEGGELEVMHSDYYGEIVQSSYPDTEYMLILNKKQRKDRYWWLGDGVERRGKKVVAL
jgi:hypothetical protein